MGVPFKMLVVYFMENPTQMDDDWGYPYFRKLPYRCIDVACTESTMALDHSHCLDDVPLNPAGCVAGLRHQANRTNVQQVRPGQRAG